MTNQHPAADAAPINPPEGLCRLPQFRPVALKLLKLVSNDDVDFNAVARLLSSDPAFSAEVMALDNSPLYGTSVPATSLTRAIVVLGLDRTRALALTVAMQAFIGNVQVTPELQNCWRHSVASALVAEELAPLYALSRDHGYTAGLMHDIGRLGLLKAYPKPYGLLLADAYDSCPQVLEAERRVFQVDHCQSGFWLTRSWGFPEELQSIAAHHHAGCFGREQGIVGLASVSCLLADMLGFASVNYTSPTRMEDLVSGMPEPSNFDLSGMRDRIQERLQTVDIAA